MATTVLIPDDLYKEAQSWTGGRSFSDFASEAIRRQIGRLSRESLARELEAGYQAEAQASSLDEDWATTEVDGL